MNQHKKIWFSVFILIFMFSLYSVTALATEITPEQVEEILSRQSSQASSQSAAGTVSSKAAVSSRRPVTSKKPVSSEIFSEASGDVSGNVSGGLFSSGEESSEIVLPSVDSIEENNPLSSVIVDTAANKKMNWIGILSWVCIALGIVVVLIVVFSNRRPPRGGGRKRYRRPNRSHKKRLLNDKYYRNLKY
ncbi:hypothetical protein [Caproiciproducens sp. CPB-2]|uniref:hypothetical protein n=1 Tax=Caproiciproducens sp. CPB-2 TaxID=3030017 RepID=UPI0023DCC690|nr:hypothetical protein [Caproiciproducens sp. CPB-2]MDF1494352.1 hypothetical protein [Caproiciproducens sp. CPB-2]